MLSFRIHTPLLVLLLSGTLSAQADSPDVQRLIDRADSLRSVHYEQFGRTAYRALATAQRTGSPYQAGQASDLLSAYHYDAGTTDSSIHYSTLAIGFYEQSDHPRADFERHLAEATRLLDEGRDAEGLLAAQRAIDWARAHPDNPNDLADAYWMARASLYQQDHFKQAIDYADKALAIYRAQPAGDDLVYQLSKYGNIVRRADDTAGALKVFHEAEALLDAHGTPASTALWSLNYAALLLDEEQFETAEGVLQRGLAAGQDVDPVTLALIVGNLGRAALGRENYAEARDYLRRELAMVGDTDDPYLIMDFQVMLGEAFAGLGQYDSAYYYTDKGLYSYLDYLFDDNETRIDELDQQYRTAEKDRQIAAQTQRLWIIGIGLTLALLAGGYLFVLSRRLRRSNAEVRDLVKQKEGLIGEIHHRVKNNLQVISSLLRLQSRALDDQQAVDALHESRSRVDSMGLIHQKLYQTDDVTTLDMPDYIQDLGETLLNTYRLDDRIAFHQEIAAIDLDVDTAIPLALILNELVTNSLKHGYPEGMTGTIFVRLRAIGDHSIEMVVEDDGIGELAPTGGSGSTSFGSKLIDLLTTKLKGELVTDRSHGSRTVLTFPRVGQLMY